MASFQLIPAEPKFYDWFEKSAQNLVDAATLLETMFASEQDWPGRVAQLTELEHQGDFITHDIFDLLHKTFVTPLDPPEIEMLTSKLDDVIDFIHAAADSLLIYRIDKTQHHAHELAKLILASTKEIAQAIGCLRDKKRLNSILPHVHEIHRLENEADRILRTAIGDLVDQRDVFELVRWQEVYQLLESASDRCEDVADVLRTVVIKYA
ncbi:DUF47 domain-containing protein [Chloroflexia bacterium SDU3-3]|nr:DUF47 domain-containing protein [Chloroflexia bacterium SDU3-3]